MDTLSNVTQRKFLDSIKLEDLEIETDTGWEKVTHIHKTVPYKVWILKTEKSIHLEAADTHILFDSNFNEIYVKDIIVGETKIATKHGFQTVIKCFETDIVESMYDLTVDSPNHRFYSNDILSHNTTIINALSYGLYGQALTNIKKDNLINHINGKNMLVTVNFEKNGTKYRIERGRKPNILKLFVNDKEVEEVNSDDSQGDSRETQKDIEDILEMSHTMFKHLVALNTYTEPFLSMKAADQREVIEQLLGITVLSSKSESLKLLIKDTKDQIQKEEFRIEGIKTANDNVKRSISSIELKSAAWKKKHESDIDSYTKSIIHLESIDIEKEIKLHNELKEWEEYNRKFSNLSKRKATVETALNQAQKSVLKITKDMESLKINKCHACEQELHHDIHEKMKATLEKSLEESTSYYTSLDSDMKKIEQDIIDMGPSKKKPSPYYDSMDDAQNHKNNLYQLGKALESRLNDKNPYDEQIEDLKNAAIQEISWDKINEFTKTKEHQEFLLKLLTNKDSFIRKKIIDQNISYLNNRLSFYLDKLGLPHTVVFQNDLSVEISQLGKDLDFDNLSRGERNRLILSMSFAFRDVWEGLYHSINLLFIDELIDSGMDSAGVENSLSVLKKLNRERNKNIFLISHKEELIGRVENVLKVIKEGGFTTYNIE